MLTQFNPPPPSITKSVWNPRSSILESLPEDLKLELVSHVQPSDFRNLAEVYPWFESFLYTHFTTLLERYLPGFLTTKHMHYLYSALLSSRPIPLMSRSIPFEAYHFAQYERRWRANLCVHQHTAHRTKPPSSLRHLSEWDLIFKWMSDLAAADDLLHQNTYFSYMRFYQPFHKMNTLEKAMAFIENLFSTTGSPAAHVIFIVAGHFWWIIDMKETASTNDAYTAMLDDLREAKPMDGGRLDVLIVRVKKDDDIEEILERAKEEALIGKEKIAQCVNGITIIRQNRVRDRESACDVESTRARKRTRE